MVAYRAMNKRSAMAKAAKMRKKGYNCAIFKKKHGWGVSVRRK